MTKKQKLAASELVKNGGFVGEAMIAAGYSPNTAKTPTKLTRSKGWQELMDTAFPDEMITKIQRELLEASVLSYIQFPDTEDDKVIRKDLLSMTGVKVVDIRSYSDRSSSGYIRKYKKVAYTIPLYPIRLRAIETILKLKNKFPSQKHTVIENSGPFIVQVVSYEPDLKDTSSNHLSDFQKDYQIKGKLI